MLNTDLICVTEPDIFVSDHNSIFLYCDPIYNENIISLLSNISKQVVVYIGGEQNSLEWVFTAHNSTDYTLIDASMNSFVTGLLIDKPKTYYYNSSIDLGFTNLNALKDPFDFIHSWIKKLEE